MSWEQVFGIHSVWNDDPLVNTDHDLRHFRKRWDYFVSPLLGMQSWTGWFTYHKCFILFRGNYTNSWKACLHAGKMLMDICRHVSEVLYVRAKYITFSSANKLRSEKSSTRKLRIYNSCKPRTIQQLLVLELHRPAHQRLSACSVYQCLRKKEWISLMPNSTIAKLKQ